MVHAFTITISDEDVAMEFKQTENKSQLVTSLLSTYFFSKRPKDTQEELSACKQQLTQLSEDYETRQKQLTQVINNIMGREAEEQKQKEELEILQEKKRARKYELYLEDCEFFGLDKQIAEMYFNEWDTSGKPIYNYLLEKKLIEEDNKVK